MKKYLSIAFAFMLAVLFTGFAPAAISPAPVLHRTNAVQTDSVTIYNNTSSRTITGFKIGTIVFTGLSISAGTHQTFSTSLNPTGSSTVSVTCFTAWTGTIEYYQGASEIACTNLGSTATHSMTVTLGSATFRSIYINDETNPC